MPQRRVEPMNGNGRRKAKPGMQVAAVGLAVLDAGSLQARTHQIEGIRLAATAMPAADADAYQTARGLLAIGDVPGAMSAFRQALVQSPQSVDALNGLGVTYDRMGRYDLSRTYYESALAIDPGAVLVLNNLGYSLYLQHDYKAAIPILQRVMGSTDAAARANAQRLLTLISAQIRNNAAAASTAIALREIAPVNGEVRLAIGGQSRSVSVADAIVAGDAVPAKGKRRAGAVPQAQAVASLATEPAPHARIEQSSNGEQRLVLGGPAPERVLTASLGDAAVLVLVAPAWTAGDERALAVAEAARDRMEARAAAADVAALFPAEPETVATASLADADTAARLAAEFPTAATDTDAAAVPAELQTQAVVAAATIAPAPKRSKRRRDAPADVTAIVAVAQTDVRTLQPAAETTPSAWLLAGHRLDRPTKARTIAANSPRESAGLLAFESDDRDLNAFAARMTGIEAPPTVVSDAEAVARLETLLARLRKA